MSRHGSSWLSPVRVLLAPVAVLGALVGVTALAQTAAPATSVAAPVPHAGSAVSLETGGATVKLANGQSWTLTVAENSAFVTAGVLRAVSGTGAEGHLWQWETKTPTFAFDASTGVGTLKPGKDTSPVGTFDLTFKATSHKPVACVFGSETKYLGTLSGEAKIVTGLKKAGTVGGKSLKFNVKTFTPFVLVDSNCDVETDTCLASIALTSGNHSGVMGTAAEDSLSGKATSDLEVTRTTKLKSPKNSSRIDFATVKLKKAPSWNSATKVLSVSGPTSGLVTGSATLSGGKTTTGSYPCSYKGKSYTLKVTTNSTAKYSSPAGKGLIANTELTGKLKAPTSTKTGFYEIITVS
jgi:hypothetical protein